MNTLKQKLLIYLCEVELIPHKRLENKTADQLLEILHDFFGTLPQVNRYYKELN